MRNFAINHILSQIETRITALSILFLFALIQKCQVVASPRTRIKVGANTSPNKISHILIT